MGRGVGENRGSVPVEGHVMETETTTTLLGRGGCCVA